MRIRPRRVRVNVSEGGEVYIHRWLYELGSLVAPYKKATNGDAAIKSGNMRVLRTETIIFAALIYTGAV